MDDEQGQNDVFTRLRYLEEIKKERIRNATSLDDEKARREEEKLGEAPDSYEELQREQLKIRLKREKQNVDNDDIENKLRKEYAGKIFFLVMWWLIFLGGLTLADALFSFSVYVGGNLVEGIPLTDIWLSDALLMFLWGTATATVVGLFVYVAKYLFPTKK